MNLLRPARIFPPGYARHGKRPRLPRKDTGVRVCLLRTGLVLSRHGGLLGRMLLPFRLGLGARLGDGKQWMSWVHIDDYVAMLLGPAARRRGQRPLQYDRPATGQQQANSPPRWRLRCIAPLRSWLPAMLAEGRSWVNAPACCWKDKKCCRKRVASAGYRYAFANLADALHDLLGR